MQSNRARHTRQPRTPEPHPVTTYCGKVGVRPATSESVKKVYPVIDLVGVATSQYPRLKVPFNKCERISLISMIRPPDAVGHSYTCKRFIVFARLPHRSYAPIGSLFYYRSHVGLTSRLSLRYMNSTAPSDYFQVGGLLALRRARAQAGNEVCSHQAIRMASGSHGRTATMTG